MGKTVLQQPWMANYRRDPPLDRGDGGDGVAADGGVAQSQGQGKRRSRRIASIGFGSWVREALFCRFALMQRLSRPATRGSGIRQGFVSPMRQGVRSLPVRRPERRAL